MSRWLPDRLGRASPLRIAIGAEQVAWARDGTVHTALRAQWAAALEGAHPRAPIEFVAANDVSVHWVQAVPGSLRSLQELRQAAAARCAQLFGSGARDWLVAGDWRVDKPFLCAAIPRPLVSSIRNSLEERGSKITWTTALAMFMGERASSIPESGWCAVRAHASLAIFHVAAGCTDHITIVRVAPASAEQVLREHADRCVRLESARCGFDAGDEITWFDVTGAGSTSSEAEAALAMRAHGQEVAA